MLLYIKDLFGKDWKVTTDTSSFQATKTKIELKIGRTLIKTKIYNITIGEANALKSFISINENELLEEAKTILKSYRIFYYIIRYRSFAETFFEKLLNKNV